MDQSIKAGIIGIILAVIINITIYIPPPLDWIPTFTVALFVIIIYRLNTIKDALIATFMTYIFNQGILSTLILATYYASNEPNQTITIDPYLILSPILTAISSIIAAYIGVTITKKRKPPQKTQPQPTDIPPELQTV
jgi:hypothetical protein